MIAKNPLSDGKISFLRCVRFKPLVMGINLSWLPSKEDDGLEAVEEPHERENISSSSSSDSSSSSSSSFLSFIF